MSEGCGEKLADGQWWSYCGETDMGQTEPALCTECGGNFYRANKPEKEWNMKISEQNLAMLMKKHSGNFSFDYKGFANDIEQAAFDSLKVVSAMNISNVLKTTKKNIEREIEVVVKRAMENVRPLGVQVSAINVRFDHVGVRTIGGEDDSESYLLGVEVKFDI